MGATSIEWTDVTWNPVRGCTKVSPGCKHCYAETFAERWRGVKGHAFEQGFDLRLVPEKLAEPLPNVWLGVSVEDQARAEERIPHHLTHACKACVAEYLRGGRP